MIDDRGRGCVPSSQYPLAAQAGLPQIDFSAVVGRRRTEYFAAVQAGMDRNYRPMGAIFAGWVDEEEMEHRGGDD